MIRVVCKGCGASLPVRDLAIGSVTACDKCDTEYTVSKRLVDRLTASASARSGKAGGGAKAGGQILRVRCGGCGKPLKVKNPRPGAQYTCGNCGHELVISRAQALQIARHLGIPQEDVLGPADDKEWDAAARHADAHASEKKGATGDDDFGDGKRVTGAVRGGSPSDPEVDLRRRAAASKRAGGGVVTEDTVHDLEVDRARAGLDEPEERLPAPPPRTDSPGVTPMPVSPFPTDVDQELASVSAETLEFDADLQAHVELSEFLQGENAQAGGSSPDRPYSETAKIQRVGDDDLADLVAEVSQQSGEAWPARPPTGFDVPGEDVDAVANSGADDEFENASSALFEQANMEEDAGDEVDEEEFVDPGSSVREELGEWSDADIDADEESLAAAAAAAPPDPEAPTPPEPELLAEPAESEEADESAVGGTSDDDEHHVPLVSDVNIDFQATPHTLPTSVTEDEPADAAAPSEPDIAESEPPPEESVEEPVPNEPSESADAREDAGEAALPPETSPSDAGTAVEDDSFAKLADDTVVGQPPDQLREAIAEAAAEAEAPAEESPAPEAPAELPEESVVEAPEPPATEAEEEEPAAPSEEPAEAPPVPDAVECAAVTTDSSASISGPQLEVVIPGDADAPTQPAAESDAAPSDKTPVTDIPDTPAITPASEATAVESADDSGAAAGDTDDIEEDVVEEDAELVVGPSEMNLQFQLQLPGRDVPKAPDMPDVNEDAGAGVESPEVPAIADEPIDDDALADALEREMASLDESASTSTSAAVSADSPADDADVGDVDDLEEEAELVVGPSEMNLQFELQLPGREVPDAPADTGSASATRTTADDDEATSEFDLASAAPPPGAPTALGESDELIDLQELDEDELDELDDLEELEELDELHADSGEAPAIPPPLDGLDDDTPAG